MKIEKLTIPNGYKQLRASILFGLSDVVLLAGPNGGGKTRVLDALRDNRRTDPGPGLGEQRRDLKRLKDELAQIEAQIPVGAPGQGPGSAHELKQRREQLVNEIGPRDRAMHAKAMIEPDLLPEPTIADLTSAAVSFANCSQSAPSVWKEAQRQIRHRFDFNAAIQHGPNAVYGLLTNWISSRAEGTALDPERRDEIQKSYARLNSITNSLLGAEFTIATIEDGPQIFGHPLDAADKLSAGQKILLALVYLLYFQEDTDKDLLVVWDEPETHLHPDAVIKVLEQIRSACPRAQIWIATHSVHVLAHFQDHGIWFVKDGVVKRGGRVAERVLSSLVGGDQQLDKLAEFLALPAQRALRAFAVQCLVPPGTVDTLPGDAQTKQIYDILSSNVGARPLAVLDYGAGKGRLLAELLAPHSDAKCEPAFSYFAYDFEPSEEDAASVDRYLGAAYGNASGRYRVGQSASALADWKSTFDVVVLCNALHEIDPTKWSELFGPSGSITMSLRDDGHFFLVEDYVLAAGERAHRFGFLLLDRAELKLLFAAGDHEIQSFDHPKQQYRNRLKTHVMARDVIARMTLETIVEALRSLRDRSFSEAREHHANEDRSAESGHKLAVSAHQHLNALLALEALDRPLAHGPDESSAGAAPSFAEEVLA